MRLKLKIFRVKMNMSQEQMAKSIGYKRANYGKVESGERKGSERFWSELQRVYNLSDKNIKELQKNET